MDMTVSRQQAEPTNVEDYIDYLEQTLLEDLCGHEAVQCRKAVAFFRGLSSEQVDIVDQLLRDEFASGVREGRSRQQYGEDDPSGEPVPVMENTGPEQENDRLSMLEQDNRNANAIIGDQAEELGGIIKTLQAENKRLRDSLDSAADALQGAGALGAVVRARTALTKGETECSEDIPRRLCRSVSAVLVPYEHFKTDVLRRLDALEAIKDHGVDQ